MKSLTLLLIIVGAAHCQVFINGPCPEVQVVQNFDVKSYLGNWYEAARYFAFFELGAKCSSATYSLNNGSVSVWNRAIDELTGGSRSIKGTATVDGDGTEGRLTVTFPTTGVGAQYLILGTDYKNWAAVFSCKGTLISARFAWILTRDKTPSNDVLTVAKAVFTSQNISTDLFLYDSKRDCPDV